MKDPDELSGCRGGACALVKLEAERLFRGEQIGFIVSKLRICI